MSIARGNISSERHSNRFLGPPDLLPIDAAASCGTLFEPEAFPFSGGGGGGGGGGEDIIRKMGSEVGHTKHP